MEKEQRADRTQAFISHVITRMKDDRGMGARLRRADNPATEYQSWEYLAPFGVTWSIRGSAEPLPRSPPPLPGMIRNVTAASA